MSTPTKYPLETYVCQYKNAKGKWVTRKEVATIEEAANWYQLTTKQPKIRVKLQTVLMTDVPEAMLLPTHFHR